MDDTAEPYRFTACGDRVLFLRPAPGGAPRLWCLDMATGTERQVTSRGLDGYATDAAGRVAVAGDHHGLVRVDVASGSVTELAPGPATEARLDPTGRRVAYLRDGTLRVVDESGSDQLLAGEDGVDWGVADATARVFGRREGYWWSPDGDRLLACRIDPHGGRPPTTSLHLLHLDGFWVDVRWDRQAFPYLASVTWRRGGGPLLAVLRRGQRHGLVLAVDGRTGETQVHAELDDPRWVTTTPGTPAYLPDGRVVIGGELTTDGTDTRCLFADGTLLTPPELYVHRLAGILDGSGDLLVEASQAEPSERHVHRVRLAGGSDPATRPATGSGDPATRPAASSGGPAIRLTVGSGRPAATRLTTTAGWHTGHTGGGTVVVVSESLEYAEVRATAYRGRQRRRIDVAAAGQRAEPGAPGEQPRPALTRVTDRRLPSGVLYPSGHIAGRRLPVLVWAAGEQAVIAARSRWTGLQAYAEAGFAVVGTDPRGTAGISPGFEKAAHRRVLDLRVADHTDALSALAAKHPDLDLARVAVTGTGLGGAVALAAALCHPERYRAVAAEDPLVDWHDLPAGYAERYLGLPEAEPEAYAHHDLVELVGQTHQPGARHGVPVLLVDSGNGSGTAELAGSLRAAGHHCEMLSRQAATNDHVVGFVRRALGGGR